MRARKTHVSTQPTTSKPNHRPKPQALAAPPSARYYTRTPRTPELLSRTEACEILDCSLGFLEKLLRERRLPYHKIGHLVRINRTKLDEFLAFTEVR
jgi:excisionase family DNA binding protein